jgi:3-hydroxyisobutyrate dehydrogenase
VDMSRVGFIGLGLMGKPMSKRILQAGHELTVFNRSKAPVEELAALGARAAQSPREVAGKSEFVILMLPDSPDVEKVVLGGNGVCEGASEGSIVIDMSTVSPFTEIKIAEVLRQRGVCYLDAPVTGSTPAAEAGTLTIMVGGPREAFDRSLPILQCMGKNIHYMGNNGAGQFTKLCNQIAVSLNLLGTCEALLLASKAGLDPLKMIEVLGSGAGSSWQLVNLGPKIVAKDFTPGFKAEHLRKDLRILSEVSEQLGLPLFGTAVVHQLVKSLVENGMGKCGTQSLITILEQLSRHRLTGSAQ